MKKSLYMTSALVAAGLLAFGSTDAVAKAKKMKVGISGSYKAVIGYARQQSAFTNVGTGTTATDYNELDVKTDSEVHFKGSTKLDNGLTMAVKVELEGDTETAADIDATGLTISGGFGSILLGSEVAASAILSQGGAHKVGAIGGAGGGDAASWVQRPAANAVAAVQGHNIGGGEHMKIRWLSKAFSGFTIGASYVPSMTGGTGMAANGGTAGTENAQIDAGVKYSGKMGGNSVTASYTTWRVDGASDQNSWAAGATVGFGAINIAVGYLDVSDETKTAAGLTQSGTAASADREAVNVGVQYTAGPMKVALNYFNAEAPLATATAGDDAVTKIVLGTTYNMGPGVDFVGSLAQVDWADETAAVGSNNKGTAVVGGFVVGF